MIMSKISRTTAYVTIGENEYYIDMTGQQVISGPFYHQIILMKTFIMILCLWKEFGMDWSVTKRWKSFKRDIIGLLRRNL